MNYIRAHDNHYYIYELNIEDDPQSTSNKQIYIEMKFEDDNSSDTQI